MNIKTLFKILLLFFSAIGFGSCGSDDDEKKEIIIIDATRSTGKVSVRKENVVELFCKGYKIYRKK